MDFYKLRTKRTKEGVLIYPDFVVQSSKDLLVKGGDFYAVWDEERGLWSRDEMDVARIVDADLLKAAEGVDGDPLLMASYESKSWTQYQAYVKTLEDSQVELDQSLTFADDPPDRKKYASKRLPYSLSDAPCPAYEEIMSTLYHPVEREKLEWSIGSIIAGDSKKNQKFCVLYGPPGSGKGTFLNVVEKLFEGYYIPFDARAMGTSSANFALAGFKHNPLVAIQHDGDLSRIEDNTKLNQIVSHEILAINEKYKSEFYTRAIAFLYLGTNEPVKITGAKSGIIRRLLDVHPSGMLIPSKNYHILMSQVEFELGSIAQHCLSVYYRLGKNYYAGYRPTSMMLETDVFYNFVESMYDSFYVEDGVTLEVAWNAYKEFCEDALIRHKLQRHQFRSELSNYFEHFEERTEVKGERKRSYFWGFKTHRFVQVDNSKPLSLSLDQHISLLDEVLADMPAQYAKGDGTPEKYWTDAEREIGGETKRPRPDQVVSTTLKDLDTSRLHYVKVPEDHIVIDFDLKDEHGNKSRERNLEAAAEWPPTYTEFSQGGEGVHLHYHYAGPGSVSELANVYSDGIEVKTLTGNSSLRRRLSGCNSIEIATITSGLALKEKPVQDAKAMSSERAVRKLIIENLRKEHHPGTKPSIEFIKKILDDAQREGFSYDVSDLYPDVYSFAMDSTNHARYCMKLVKDMQFASEDMELNTTADVEKIAFYDVEVFPNLFVVCYKFAGDDNIVRMINPTPDEINELLRLKLVGFNCRRYDNHILYARAMGYSNAELYDLSVSIIENDRSKMFGGAYDLSYTDIYDFSSKKQSLKKFEIELGLHHMELGIPWHLPVPEEQWDLVAEYCANDVMATEATFEARRADFTARQILAALSGLSVNASTQMHTAKIIFGADKKPQSKFIYTDLSEMFPGYRFDFGKSTYRDEEVGEGGYVYAEPGYYKNVPVFDVTSMHPTSIEQLEAFGPYTEKFSELKNARVAIKDGDLASARRMMDGQLAPYLENEDDAEALAYALKIVINIVYGLTSAKFENMFRDPRNKDNIVAKRGALFMIELKHQAQARGMQVVHIKTDSIKVVDPTEEEAAWIVDFGKQYGYDFVHEATYEDFVLLNDAVYIARKAGEPWPELAKALKDKNVVGAQFQHPFVYKTLLSSEQTSFEDLLETRNVVKGSIWVVNDKDRRFVGRIGQFVPIQIGHGGGSLMRVADVLVTDKETGEKHIETRDYAVASTKGYEWIEAEIVRKNPELEQWIDMTYYQHLVEKAQQALADQGYHL